MTTDVHTTPDNSKLGKLRSALIFFAQISGLLSLAGFFLSIGLHYLVFSRWGINFLQVAGPSDVLMSGIWLTLVFVAPVAVASFLGSALFSGIANRPAKYRRRPTPGQGKVSTRSRILWGIYIIAAVALLVTTIAYFRDIALSFVVDLDRDEAMEFAWGVLLFVTFSIGAVVAALGRALAVGGVTVERILALVVTLSLAFIGLLVWGNGMIGIQAAYGFQHEHLIAAEFEPCGGQGRALWLGGHFAILECVDGQGRRSGIVVASAGFDTLRVQRR